MTTPNMTHPGSNEASTSSQANTTSPALIALSWLVVLIPSAWGIYLTALRAANLFH